MMKNILALWEKWSQVGLRYVWGQIKCFDGISCETWGTKLLWEILFGKMSAIPFPSEQKEAVPSCGQGAHSLSSGFWAASARPGPALGAGWVREGLAVHQILHKITFQLQLLNFRAKKCVRRGCCVAHWRCIASAGCRGSIPKADFLTPSAAWDPVKLCWSWGVLQLKMLGAESEREYAERLPCS